MALPPILYPKAIQDMINLLGGTVFGDREGAAAAPPAQIPGANKAKVLAALQQNPNLTEQQYTQIQTWLAGGELVDPRLAAWVASVTGGQPVEGAGPVTAPSTGMSSANDNGIGGGGPEGAAAQSGLAQQATLPAGAGLPAPKANATVPGAAPGAGGGGAAPVVPGGAKPAGLAGTDAEGDLLLSDPKSRMRYVDRAAGLDPLSGGRATQFFNNVSSPAIDALTGLYGYLPGGNGDIDKTTLGGNLGNFGKAFITPGQSGYKMSQDMAYQIMNNPEFLQQLTDVGTEDTSDGSGGALPGQISLLRDVMGLKNAGATGLKASWLNKQLGDLLANYDDSEMGMLPGSTLGGNGGKFTNFINSDPKARAVVGRLFGYTPR